MEREFKFTDSDFKHIRKLVREYTGISLSSEKHDLVYSRLARRLRKLGLNSFRAYTDFFHAHRDEEVVPFTNAITTNLTSFFREQHHFDYIKKCLLPSIGREKYIDKQIKIWSAGCSTGEEPYSIAMVVNEHFQREQGWDVKILATDLDSDVLKIAKNGIYSEERIASMSKRDIKKRFKKGSGENVGKVRVSNDLRELISFKKLNLMDEWPLSCKFDFIFCRNVVIYFEKVVQKRLFDRFADYIVDNGTLFIGHSESLFNVSTRFELVGKTMYRKLY